MGTKRKKISSLNLLTQKKGLKKYIYAVTSLIKSARQNIKMNLICSTTLTNIALPEKRQWY